MSMELQTMAAIRPLWETAAAGESMSVGHTDGPALPFADVFQSAIENVRETDTVYREKEYLLATGQLDNPAEVTIAATEASTSLELLIQLRNRALDAYSDLMRISM